MTSIGPSWVGRSIGNRYQIEALLGRGGMSSVYRAHDPNLNRKVAIKIIHQHLTDNPEFIQRFEQEASLVAQLRHPNIIQVHDFNHDNGIYYMVMEYIAGETLSARLDEQNIAGIRIPLLDNVNIMAKICDAVDYAHRQRMIHRDLKPANIMINLMGEPILMDFGIAKLVGSSAQTAAGGAFGTAAYMAPEHVRGEKIDHRADIYSLGIVLYEMISGKPPFDGESTYQVMIQQVQEPVPDIQDIELDIPQALVDILEKALAKLPDARYQSAGEMQVALKKVARQLDGSADEVTNRHMERLNSLWQEARTAYEAIRYGECIDKLDELDRLDKDYQHARVQHLRIEALEKWYALAQQEYEDGHMDLCLSIVNEIRDRDPGFPINELEYKARLGVENAGLQTELVTLYATAVSQLKKRKYAEALQSWETIQLQKGPLDFPDEKNVETQAKEGLCAELYDFALDALDAKKPELVLEQWQKVLAVDPDYPDEEQIEEKAHKLIAEREAFRAGEKKRQKLAVASVIFILLLLLVVGLWNVGGDDDTTAVADSSNTVNAAAIIADDTSTPTMTATTAATDTAQPTATVAATETPAPTDTAEPTQTNTPEPTPTATAASTDTPEPTETAVSSPTPEEETSSETAVVNDNASLFASPDSSSNELAVLRQSDEVRVFGKSETGNWFYVVTNDGVQGFVIGTRIDWDGDVDSLPVRQPGAFVDVNATPEITPVPGNDIELIIYPLVGTEVCNGEAWTQSIFMEGSGNGPFSYYWNGEPISLNVSGSTSFSVSSEGAPIIGTGRVVSADGTFTEKELFINKPSCDG